ncbi:hypothetical protein [Corallincola spongiicola]|uniref:Uncharacterized protein n=1 Tax=Corallincola spongiicola TaxID=2520508 RepID=A0ABY1WMD6_9GAMM|nr:hypothetical protein [Corallincola spongiicola]TAA43586.1 hypothetical protein EXY25_13595 [Corallincola spongiicola]
MKLESLGKLSLMILGLVALYGASEALMLQTSSMYGSSTHQSGSMVVAFISVLSAGFCFFLAKMSGEARQGERGYLKTFLS